MSEGFFPNWKREREVRGGEDSGRKDLSLFLRKTEIIFRSTKQSLGAWKIGAVERQISPTDYLFRFAEWVSFVELIEDFA